MTNSHSPSSAESRDAWLILKRDLYFRPNAQGYTGIKAEAGRYPWDVAKGYEDSGLRVMHEDDAPEFTQAVFPDLAIQHLQEQIDHWKARAEKAEARPATDAQSAQVLKLLSPDSLPMEDDPDVLQVARAIAERGIGRFWDDFPETDAFGTDQGDLIEYARAAVEIFRRLAAQPPAAPVETDQTKQLRAAVEYWRLAAERRDERRERTGMDIPEAATLDAPEYCSADTVHDLQGQAFKLSPHDQYRLAFFIAENVGYVLAKEIDFDAEPQTGGKS